MKVNWTEAARTQLRDIRGFVVGSSPQYATKMVDRLTRRSQQIAIFPGQDESYLRRTMSIFARYSSAVSYHLPHPRRRDRYHCCCAWRAAVAGRTIATHPLLHKKQSPVAFFQYTSLSEVLRSRAEEIK